MKFKASPLSARADDALQLARVGSWAWHSDSNDVRCSRELNRILGTGEDETAGPFEQFLEHVHADDRARVERLLRETVGRNEPVEYEYRACRPDGAVRFLSARASAIQGTDGNFRQVVGIAQDVTPQRDAERDRDRYFTLSRDLLAIAGTDGYFKRVNPSFERVLGYDDATLLAEPFLDLVHPEDRDATLAEIAKLANGELVINFENRFRCADGTYRWLLWNTAPDPESGLLFASAQDITERKCAEQRIRENEQNLAITLQSIGDAVIATDDEGRVVRMNPVAEAMTGWPRAEAAGRPLAEVFRICHDQTRRPVEDPVAEVLRRGVVIGMANHTLLLARDGAERPIADSAAPIRDEQGAITGVVLVFRDLTEQYKLDALARRALRDFRRVIAAIPEPLAIHREGQFLWVNRAFATLLGYDDTAGMIGTPVLEHVHPEEAWRIEQILGAGARGDAATDEWRLVRRDGQTVVVEFTRSEEIEFEGERSLMTVGRDVTARKAIESRLMLADRMVTVGTMAAGVAHEINNPLAYVLSNVGLAASEIPGVIDEVHRSDRAFAARMALRSMADEPSIRLTGIAERLSEIGQALDEAREGAERVRNIVRDLKTFSRGADERLALVDLRVVLDSTLNLAANELRHHATVVREYGEAPLVEANESRLGQVFLNLIVNAAQAIPEGGVDSNRVTIATRTDAQGRAVVEVRDTGTGIAREHLGRIFDPFFTTKPVGSGTGLGLSICHSIVTGLGGEIDVESETGRGTCFRVTLPAATFTSSGFETTAPSMMPQPRRRILVVDDEPFVVSAVRRAIGRDHDVTTETRGQAAIERMRRGERFDLVLCDLMMPETTGMDVHRALEGIDAALVERIVFMTGGAFTPTARAFLERVPNARLEKPFEVHGLRALIRSQCR